MLVLVLVVRYLFLVVSPREQAHNRRECDSLDMNGVDSAPETTRQARPRVEDKAENGCISPCYPGLRGISAWYVSNRSRSKADSI